MKRAMRRVVVVAGVVCAGSGFLPSPSSAHTSSYCGHSADGILTLTIYSHRADYYGHNHVYEHWSGLTKLHNAARTCNPWHPGD
jgi:hypothetical protein